MIKKVLFVCLGNLCRSPLAEEIFRKKVKDLGMENEFKVDSCGTETYHLGELPDPRSMEVAEEKGLQLYHFARQIVPNDFQSYDLLIAMDRLILEEMRQFSPLPQLMNKVKLFRTFDTKPSQSMRVPDPYMGSIEEFRDVYNIIDRCSDGLLRAILEQNKAG